MYNVDVYQYRWYAGKCELKFVLLVCKSRALSLNVLKGLRLVSHKSYR